jgi:carboxypeptidase PM20D1
MLKKILISIGGIFIILVCVLLFNTFTVSSKQIKSIKNPSKIEIDKNRAAANLAGAIKIKTVSYNNPAAFDKNEFANFRAYLEKTYPKLHRELKQEIVGGLSILYTWKGSDPSLKPILLLAHQDVVPVDAKTLGQWTHPPFSGDIADGFVWGRGSIDLKNGLIGIMEAVEYLISTGFKPVRTIYLSFGHDEEVGGTGAKITAALLKERNIRLDYVLDEGGLITNGIFPGVSGNVAIIGISEKGYLSLEIVSKDKGGHSSQPPKKTALGRLAKAIVKLEENPFPGGLTGPTRLMFDYLAPEMNFTYKLLFSNIWFFKPLLNVVLSGSPSTNATIRTTTAFTMASGSPQDNILPMNASAIVNFRIFPGETMDSVTDYVKALVADEYIEVRPYKRDCEPSQVSDTKSATFIAIQNSISELYPGTTIAPYLVIGGTDARSYNGVAENSYRFLPIHLTSEDLRRMHGLNERISVDQFAQSIKFYTLMIQKTAVK